MIIGFWVESTTEILSCLYRVIPLFAIAFGARQVPLGAPAASPFTVDFDKLAIENLECWHTPGLAIAIVDGNDTFSKV